MMGSFPAAYGDRLLLDLGSAGREENKNLVLAVCLWIPARPMRVLRLPDEHENQAHGERGFPRLRGIVDAISGADVRWMRQRPDLHIG